MDTREKKTLTGCLLQAGVNYPQDEILVCGLCPNKSNDRGNLGTLCKKSPAIKKG